MGGKEDREPCKYARVGRSDQLPLERFVEGQILDYREPDCPNCPEKLLGRRANLSRMFSSNRYYKKKKENVEAMNTASTLRVEKNII